MKHIAKSMVPSGAREICRCLASLSLALFLVSCQKPFDVNVKAADPIKVDVTMDVHVYQHGTAATYKQSKDGETCEDAVEYKKVMERRRNRMEDIQTLKNDRVIGENHTGRLSIRINDGDSQLWPMDYVRKTVKEENDDRSYLIEYEAVTKNKNIGVVEREQWTDRQRKSHPGEWIEVESDGKLVWVQKKSPKSSL